MRPVSRSMLARLGVAASLCAGAGCEGETAPEPTAPVSELTVTLPATGGRLEVEAASGARLTVTLPLGALVEPLTLTLRAVPPADGTVARFELQPAGVALLAAATLAVTLPADQLPTGPLGLWFGSGERHDSVPASFDPATRTLRASTHVLGFPEAVTRKTPQADEPNEFINVGEASCQIELDSLQDRILQAQAFGAWSASQATQLVQQFAATRLVCEALGSGDFSQAQAALGALACDRQASAIVTAQALLAPESATELAAQLAPIIAAAGVVQELDATCAGATESPLDVLEAEFAAFIQAYVDRSNTPGYIDSFPTWRALWDEVYTGLRLAGDAAAVGLTSAEALIYQSLLPAMYGAVRVAAYGACSSDGDQSYLAEVLSGGFIYNRPVVPAPGLPPWAGFSRGELEADLQLCGSNVLVETYDSLADPYDSRTAGGGPSPSTHTTQIDIEVPFDGAVDLTGPVRDLACANGAVSGLPLRIVAAGEQLGVVSPLGAQLLTAPFSLGVATTLDRLSLPEEAGQTVVVQVLRDGLPCAHPELGSGSFELFRVTLRTVDSRSLTGTWNGNFSATYTPNDAEDPPRTVGGPFVLQLVQDDDIVSGSFQVTSTGLAGSVSATLSASTLLEYTLSWGGTCPGSLVGTAQLNATRTQVAAAFTGSDCAGSFSAGASSAAR